MKTKASLALLSLLWLSVISCHKHDKPEQPTGQPAPDKPVLLLKDVTVRNLPSPYYHFEYNAAGFIHTASFSSGLGIYEVFYENDRISRMVNLNEMNQDVLQYQYTNGKLSMIAIARKTGQIYRRVLVTVNMQGQLQKLQWEEITATNQFTPENNLQFTYFEDGNLKDLTFHYYAKNGVGESTYTDHFSNYDDKPNPEGFSVVHFLQDMHLLLFPSFTIQKNNPRREVRTGDGVNYEVDYTYSFDTAGRPTVREGLMKFTNGPNPGQPLGLLSNYSYYD